jgi:gamma-glutamylcyclotransferase (GGCT)/AIG2-like uncharacterized protein YtfP
MTRVGDRVPVFVYGTLKQGGRYHEVMQQAGGALTGPAQVRGGLIDLGDYPGLVSADGRVDGEVYLVTGEGLAILDRLEDFDPANLPDSLYHRRWTSLLAGPVSRAWVYWYNPVRVPPATVPAAGSWPLRSDGAD